MGLLIESLIQEIIDNFDFKKVRKVMKALDWQWWDAGRDEWGNPVSAVPKKPQLRKLAVERLREAAERAAKDTTRQSTVGGGGFVAQCDLTDPVSPYFVLAFEIESWEAPIQ